ncbi:MAG: PEP-CTERM sorting domain-containing protein [Crocosphaera sp.]|nr:PEP-CTERM sorting domain-containing protein [Crocosphaera sp.]
MNFLNPTKFVTRSLIGTVGLSAIAFCGVAESVKAADVNMGTDYLYTPGGGTTFLDFEGMEGLGLVRFQGMPIDDTKIGFTDTIVQRQADCTFDNNGSCTIPIEMTDLKLMSLDGTLLATQSLINTSTGDMTINKNGTFSSILTANVAIADAMTGNPIIEIEKVFEVKNARWSPNPTPVQGSAPPLIINVGDETISRGEMVIADDQTANKHDNGMDDFFVLTALHDSGNGTHDVFRACDTDPNDLPCKRPVPEPSTTLGLLFLGLGSVVGMKRRDKAKK